MDRLRDFASRNKRPFQFSLPISLSRRNLAEGAYSSQSQESSDSQSIVQPISRSNAATQTDMDDNAKFNTRPPATTPKLTWPARKSAEEKSETMAMGSNMRHGREREDQELLKLAEAVVAQGDALSDSGRDLSRRVNEMARDVLEANQIVERKGTEIAGLNEQLRVMRLNFNKAHAQLQKAQHLAGQVIDSATCNHHTTDNPTSSMEGDVRLMKEWVGHQDVKTWPSERVERCLMALQIMRDTNNMHFEHSKSVSEDIVSIAQVFKDVDCDPKFAALLSLGDVPTDSPDTRRQEYQEATYEWTQVAGREHKPVEKAELDDEAKKDKHPELSLNHCSCFACHVGRWATNKYGDEASETLRKAFLQSINGMESGLDGFIAATGTMPREFKQAAMEAIRVICDGNETLGPSASSGGATDEAAIREAAARFNGTFAVLTPDSEELNR